MNALKRYVWGMSSSLLLAVGFVHAADRLDPLQYRLAMEPGNRIAADMPGEDCASPCDEAGQDLDAPQ